MKLLVNNKETELTQGQTIAALAQQLELPKQGVAIALHNRMAPRAEWGKHRPERGRQSGYHQSSLWRVRP